jgi:spore maturation protein A
MRVLERAGLISRLAHLIAPLLRFYFPDTYEKKNGSDEIAANISANLLGIGNAATPLALSAMKKMQENNESPDTASDDMITLAVLNTASISIVPSTILALRRAAGSSEPFSVVAPIWICSACTSALALLLCRALRGKSK